MLKFIIALFAVLSCTTISAQDSTSSTILSGKITLSGTSKPIKGALIRAAVKAPEETVYSECIELMRVSNMVSTSDSLGNYTIILQYGQKDYSLLVEHNKYYPLWVDTINITSNKRVLDISIQLKTKEPPIFADENQTVAFENDIDFIQQPTIAYPEEARLLQVEAEVISAVLLDEAGIPTKVKFLRKTKFADTLFDNEIEKNLMQSRFTPAIWNGKPIKIWYYVPFRFRLR